MPFRLPTNYTSFQVNQHDSCDRVRVLEYIGWLENELVLAKQVLAQMPKPTVKEAEE